MIVILLLLSLCGAAYGQAQLECTGCVPTAALQADAVSPDKVRSAGQADGYLLGYQASGDTWQWIPRTFVSKTSLPVAICVGGAGYATWDLPATDGPTPACAAGTNTLEPSLAFDKDTIQSIQYPLQVPSDWAGTATDIVVRLKWKTVAIAGAARWCAQVVCVADGETDDPAFDTPVCANDTAKGTTLQANDATLTLGSGSTDTCAAGELLHLEVYREASHGGDDLDDAASLLMVELTLTRNAS